MCNHEEGTPTGMFAAPSKGAGEGGGFYLQLNGCGLLIPYKFINSNGGSVYGPLQTVINLLQNLITSE